MRPSGSGSADMPIHVASPQAYHDRHHKLAPTFESCRTCGRDKTVCRSKIRFVNYDDAQQCADEINRREGYAEPVTRYQCRWCLGWHVAHARSVHRRRRVERQRRRWLVAQLAEVAQ